MGCWKWKSKKEKEKEKAKAEEGKDKSKPDDKKSKPDDKDKSKLDDKDKSKPDDKKLKPEESKSDNKEKSKPDDKKLKPKESKSKPEDSKSESKVKAKEKEKPNEKDKPKEKEKPKEKDKPKEKEKPKEKDKPKEKEKPKEKAKPKENEKPKEKAKPPPKKPKVKPIKPVKLGGHICHPGVTRYWYCGLFLLPFFWVYAVISFGFASYYHISYQLEIPEVDQDDQVNTLFTTTMFYNFLFVMVIQLTYYMIMFECIGSKCGRWMFGILLGVSLFLCLVVIAGSIYCNHYCPKGKNEAHMYYEKRGGKVPDWLELRIQQINRLRLMSAFCALLIVLTLHIFLYNILKFLEEKKLRDLRERQRAEGTWADVQNQNVINVDSDTLVYYPKPKPKRPPDNIKIYYFNI